MTRAVHFAAAIQTFGGLLFLWLLADARLKPRWLMPLIAGSLAATVISGAAWLILQAADIVESPVGEALSAGALGTLFSTYAGDVWRVRVALTAALVVDVCALAMSSTKPKRRWLNATGLAVAGAVLVSAAWLGHAGADPGPLRALHLSVDVAHMLAAAVWLGGLLPFWLVLSEARRAATAAELAVAQRTGVRFGNLAQLAVAVLLICGIVNTGLVVDSFGDLLGGAFAGLLATKAGLLLLMLVLAADNRRRLVPQLETKGPSVGARLRRNVTGELALGGLVLLIVGVLGLTAPNGG